VFSVPYQFNPINSLLKIIHTAGEISGRVSFGFLEVEKLEKIAELTS
jgi:hypothetical protein